MYQSIYMMSLQLLVCASHIHISDYQAKMLQNGAFLLSGLLTGGGFWIMKKLGSRFRASIKKMNKSRKRKWGGEFDWGTGLGIALAAVAITLAILLVIFIINTFDVWFPILLGIIGFAAAIGIGVLIFQIRESRMY